MYSFKIAFQSTKIMCAMIISLFFSCGENTTLETQKPTLADYEIGEKWTWKWQRSVQGEVLGEGIDVKEVVDYKGELGFYYDNTRQDTIKAATIVNRTQSKNPFRDWPLRVGKKWKHIEDWVNEAGDKGRTSRDAEVIAYEEITVKAGTFWAYKIKYEGVMENFAAGGKAESTDIWWYCPDLKDTIKHTQDDGHGLYTSELIQYSNPATD